MPFPHLTSIGLLALACTLVTGCDRAGTNEPPDPEAPIRVVTTTGMIGDLLRTVGGEAVEVRNLVGEGVDPHLYKPTRDDVAALLSADLVVYNGLHLEGRMGDVLERAGADRPTIAVAESIPADRLLSSEEDGGHADPHVWLDPGLWVVCGDRVRDALVELRPERAALFDRNLESLRHTATRLDALGRDSIASIPPESRILITSHDAFNYFGRAFDLEVLGVQGISTESEAGLADLEALVELVVERRVPAVFVESSVPRRSVEALVEGARARGHSVVIGGELFSDSMGPAGSSADTWAGMVRHDIETVTRALGGTPSEPRPTDPEAP